MDFSTAIGAYPTAVKARALANLESSPPMPPPVPPAPPLDLFYSYSSKDDALRAELEKHLALLGRQGFLSGWHDRRVESGTEWERQIDQNLEAADVILLLVSADFIASKYCYDIEMTRALERHKEGTARVIPVILRSCDWKTAPFGKLQGLPKNGKPVDSWAKPDEALADVAQHVRQVVKQLRKSPLSGSSSSLGRPAPGRLRTGPRPQKPDPEDPPAASSRPEGFIWRKLLPGTSQGTRVMKSLLLGMFLLALVVMTAYNIQRTRDLADQLQRPVEPTKPIAEHGPSEPGRGGFFILEDTQICFGTVDATSVVDRAWERAFAFEFARPFASRPCITITSLCKTE